MNETCPYCGQHPYEYIDVVRGAAKPEIICCAQLQQAMNTTETK